MPEINGAFKDTLVTALHSAVQNFNESQDPNAAVAKAAQDHDFNTEQATRLVESFNTARTIFHYKNASDRTLDFKLAETTEVLPKLFANEEDEKVAGAQLVDYSDYEVPEAHYEDGLDVKAAGVRDVELGQPDAYDGDISLDTQGWRAARAVRVMRDLSKTAQDEARLASEQVMNKLTKLALDLSRGYEDVCIEKVSRLFAGYRDSSNTAITEQYGPVVAKLGEFIPPWLRDATAQIKSAAVVDDRDLHAELGLLDEAREWMEVEAEFLAVASVWDKDAADFEAEWTGLVFTNVPQKKAESLADFVDDRLLKAAQTVTTTTMTSPEGETEQRGDKSWKVDRKKVNTQQPTLGPAMGEIVRESVRKPVSEFVETGLNNVITGPTERANKSLSEKLKNTQRQIMLEDLLTNDPVLSDEAPESVAQAYGAILKIAPEVASNKEVVRAILRQVVHSVAVSPYDAQTWAQLEQSLGNIAGQSDTKKTPAAGRGR